MKSFLDKIFLRSNNLDYISKNIQNLSKKDPVNKIFNSINSFSSESEIRYVGGCIRKIINKEKIDDIDLATNLEPKEIIEALKKSDIKFFESGIDHGTVTALIDNYKFEITALRKDILTDGRHAKVKFSKDWKEDASRRDFTINSIYSDSDGNLFDPYNGKKDIENGVINFIGNTDKRIKEDYLRILRYLRFFLNYSTQSHNKGIIRILKMNIGGIHKLSKERLLDELRKFIKIETLEKLSKDKISFDLFSMIFPELKNINIFSKIRLIDKDILREKDFIFFLSLLIINEDDNLDYFLYKYKLSKKDQKRMKILDNFYKLKSTPEKFSEKNMNKIFYFEGRQAVDDILNFVIIKTKKIDQFLFELKNMYKIKKMPIMPIGADILMTKYKIPEGKQLGSKLKLIEDKWVSNNFQISNEQLELILKD